MTVDKRLHRLFPSDLVTATSYYDGISVELGNRFRDRVRGMLLAITDRPESFGYVRRPLRAAMVDGFPYLILFQISDSIVYIAGLYHASSDPLRWTDRVAE